MDHSSGIRCLAVSRTTGDVATVSWNAPSNASSPSSKPVSFNDGRKKGSTLWLHSINGRKIAKHEVVVSGNSEFDRHIYGQTRTDR